MTEWTPRQSSLPARALRVARVSPRAAPALTAAAQRLARHDLAGALRDLDRAWRLAPADAGLIGPIYGEVLLRHGERPDAAASVLAHSLEQRPCPQTEGRLVTALRRLGRTQEARERLARALRAYSVDRHSAIAEAAREAMRADAGVAGWRGLSDTLKVVAERGRRSGAVLGVPPKFRPDFRLDGRIRESRGAVEGWARLDWAPHLAPRLRLEDETGRRFEVATRRDPDGLRHTFRVSLRAARLRGERISASARLPDGHWQALPDSPLILERALKPARIRRPGTVQRPARRPPAKREVAVVVPVYRGRAETLACIASILETLPRWVTLVVVDDASPEPGLSAELARLARRGRFQLIRNARNEGFAGAVNRGMASHPQRDIVVLNSDTRVHGNWLARLRRAVYSAPDIGTATPLTHDGSIASAPRYAARALTPEQAVGLDRTAATANRGLTLELPVGVGFCLYLRRDCLDATGLLDATLFGAGYGEEVDWCLRARKRGWRHVLAADTFVLHSGGLSFGARRDALQERGDRLLRLWHRDFPALEAKFDAEDPTRVAVRRLAAAQVLGSGKRYALLVAHALRGGVERFVQERREALQRAGLGVLVLRPLNENVRDVTITSDDENIAPMTFKMPQDLDALRQSLRALRLAHAELHNFIGLDPAVIETVRDLKAPYDAYLHDYAWICPQVTLIDHSGRYCGEPDLRACERCLKRKGSFLGEPITVAQLRRRSAAWLRGARRVIAPSHDAAQRVRRHYPRLPVHIEAHQPEPTPVERAFLPGRRMRVALLGGIGGHKGYRVLLACARDARRRNLPLEFTVIGYTSNDTPLLRTGRVFVTGPYLEPEIGYLLGRERPQAVWLPSVWPETWSYTLTHALAAGLPIVTFDLGAPAERLRRLGRGSLLPLDTPPAKLNDELLRIGRWPSQW